LKALTHERASVLAEAMILRRSQIRFRLGVGAVISLLFAHTFGLRTMATWAVLYALIQAVEFAAFPPALARRRIATLPGYLGALAVLALSGAVFGSLAWFWPFIAGSWGLTCGGFLLAGSLLNTVLATQGSRAAFIATGAPFVFYLLVQPLAAFLIGAKLDNICAVSFGAAMMAFCALKLWRTSAGAFRAEQSARADLNAREREARQSRAFLDSIFENVPAMLVVKEAASGRFLLINRAGEKLLGVTRDQIIGKTDHQLFPAEQADFFVERDRAAMALGEPIVIEAEPLDTADGQRMLRTKKVPIHENGQPAYLLAVAEDITEERKAAVELALAAERAEAANQAKSSFLATMSHEIRTPLNGVLGMAQAMAADPLSAEQQARLDVIRQSGEALLAILNDVLDLAKIEAGKLELEEVDFSLAEVVSGAHAAFTALAASKGLAFELEMSQAARGAYRGDPTRVRQILYNLISNALKFTNAGSVAVKVDWCGDGLSLVVADTGIGMSPGEIDGLFQKFVQADASTTRRFGGTGLGLAICHDLVQLMGGAIEVESRIGAGSTFRARLPLPRLEAEPAEAAAPQAAPGGAYDLKVLAAEDNAVNQLVLKTLLGQAGLEPVIVSNGALAVEAWEQGDWDLILMDVQMPVLDGPGACREIRRREAALGRPRTPIIALTANAMAHHVREYLDAGMDGHVSKPIQIRQLFAAIDGLIRPPAEDPARQTA
jgi:PAS domain S-box-containing protein